MTDALEFDALVIGTGFGGSVCALRLAEQGYRVAALEQGRRITPEDIERASQSLRKLLWAPSLGCDGFFTQRILKDVAIVSGVGVGGGSLVYGAVLLKPKEGFFGDPLWRRMGVDMEAELEPHYASAMRMLGRAFTPYTGRMDDHLKATAEKMGVGDTYGPVPLGIYFRGPGVTQPDPFFDGKGPERAGCTQCGRCLTGCPVNAKNTLDKNYLYLAERLGAQVIGRQKVVSVRPYGDRYEVEAVDPLDASAAPRRYRAQRVFFAGGVLGTVELLLRCRDELQTLPALSPRIGDRVRTNSEAIVGILSSSKEDLTKGTAISSHFYPNDHTHITQNRFPAGYEFMKWYMGPMVDGGRPWLRALKVILLVLLTPWRALQTLFQRNWYKHISVLTVMQSLDSQISLRLGRSLLTGFRRGLVSESDGLTGAPSYIPEANAAARAFAEVSGGRAQNMMSESVGNLSTTAHVLGGAAMSVDVTTGVIDANHEVHGYPGLYVVDGSALPVNIGVNPSLTITAMAERCMERLALATGKPSLATGKLSLVTGKPSLATVEPSRAAAGARER